MTIPGSAISLLSATAGAPAGYEIERSLRFNSADSAYLNRTPSSAGNRKTWTWSGWVKKNKSVRGVLFGGGTTQSDAGFSSIEFESDDTLRVTGWNTLWAKSEAVYRDYSAWAHVVVSFNSTESSAANQIKLYVNGQQITKATENALTQNADYGINQTARHTIGAISEDANPKSDFYLADVQFIDGQALAPTDFGEFDDNGVWQPIEYAASGPNDGTTWSNSCSGTIYSASLGYANAFDGSLATYSHAANGNTITFTPSSAIPVSSSVRIFCALGSITGSTGTADVTINGTSYVSTANTNRSDGYFTVTGITSITSITWERAADNDLVAVSAIEVDGVTLIDGDTANIGANGFHLDFANGADLGNDVSGNNNDWTPNNLVGELQTGDLGMDVVTYTGNGSTQTISGLKFQPDFVWIKNRGATGNHTLWDVVRGANKRLMSDSTAAEATRTGGLTAFTSDGFTHGNDGTGNTNNDTYVSWAWKAGGTASLNENGSIDSQVSANTDYGFSIVKYAGKSGGGSWGHGLNAPPEFIIFKRYTAAQNWFVWLRESDGTYLEFEGLNNNTAAYSSRDNVSATSTTVTLSSFAEFNSDPSSDYIAYCWSEVAGFSKFGSYTGNGSTTGPIVTTGFKPGWLMIKRSDSADSWQILDATRSPSNPADDHLFADLSNAEGSTASRGVDFLSNGFQLRGDNGGINASGGTYIYAAFAAGTPGEDLDLLFDSATNGTQEDTGAGGEVSGNYCTLNPLFSSTTLTNGNLDAEGPSNAWHIGRGTFAFPTSDKWYWEATVKGTSSASYAISVATASAANSVADFTTGTGYYGVVNNTGSTTNKVSNGTATTISTAAAWAQNDILMCAYDGATGKVWFGRNGTWYPPTSGGSAGNPGAGTNETMTASGTVFPAVHCYGTSGDMTVNFGQRPFAYSAPSGFKALCTTNLDDPTIADGSTAMDVALYTGNGSTQTISGLDFSPDFVWTKRRDGASSHGLFDVIRGATKWLGSNSTNSEQTYSDSLISFDSDGFTLGADTVWNGINQSSQTYVAWTWDAGTSTVSNTDGSITSSVRANASAGFSVVTATGSSSSSATVGHGLNAAPELIFVKLRVTAGNGFDQDWQVYHSSIGNTGGLKLNTTAATETSSAIWNNTSPTSTTFSIGASSRYDGNFVAYCFTPVEGYSAFGSYTGNGSTNGPFVYTGFRPRWIMTKRTDATGEWWISDSARDTYNAASTFLWAQSSGAEVSSTSYDYDILSNGFKLKTTYADRNASGGTFVYAAFAENPFKTARAR